MRQPACAEKTCRLPHGGQGRGRVHGTHSRQKTAPNYKQISNSKSQITMTKIP